uniref:Uncharacterized protein n=1 Tax=Tetranychus urticae TaxID=32264 RepID=T1L3X4_TETUR
MKTLRSGLLNDVVGTEPALTPGLNKNKSSLQHKVLTSSPTSPDQSDISTIDHWNSDIFFFHHFPILSPKGWQWKTLLSSIIISTLLQTQLHQTVHFNNRLIWRFIGLSFSINRHSVFFRLPIYFEHFWSLEQKKVGQLWTKNGQIWRSVENGRVKERWKHVLKEWKCKKYNFIAIQLYNQQDFNFSELLFNSFSWVDYICATMVHQCHYHC